MHLWVISTPLEVKQSKTFWLIIDLKCKNSKQGSELLQTSQWPPAGKKTLSRCPPDTDLESLVLAVVVVVNCVSSKWQNKIVTWHYLHETKLCFLQLWPWNYFFFTLRPVNLMSLSNLFISQTLVSAKTSSLSNSIKKIDKWTCV